MSSTGNPASPGSSNNAAQTYTMQPDYARVVAEQFVQQYYHVLKSYSKHLHRFYMEDSSFTVSVKDLQAETRTAKGAEIQGLVTECLPDAQADCQSFDAQFVVLPGYASQDAYYTQMPILIQSSGIFFSAGKTYNFAQTFFLAPFDSSNRGGPGYYVANDILRLSHSDSTAAVGPMENGVASAPARAPETKAPEAQRSATPTSTAPPPAAASPAPAAARAPTPTATAPKPQQTPASAPEPSTTKPDLPTQRSPTKKPAENPTQPAPAPAAAAPPAAAPPAKPKSWSALFGSKPAAPTPAPAPTPVQPVQEKPAPQAAPARTSTPTQAPEEPSSSDAPAASSTTEDYPITHSVMVQDLPEISSQEVFAVMSKFGSIRGGASAIAIRPYKDTFTAYFEYETKEALEGAVAAELTIKETRVKVVRRKPGLRKDGRGGSRGGRYSSGRGERRPDSFSRRPAVPCANGEQPSESKGADGARWQSERGERPDRAGRGDRGRGRGGRGRGRGRFGDAGAQSGSPRAPAPEAGAAAGGDA